MLLQFMTVVQLITPPESPSKWEFFGCPLRGDVIDWEKNSICATGTGAGSEPFQYKVKFDCRNIFPVVLDVCAFNLKIIRKPK